MQTGRLQSCFYFTNEEIKDVLGTHQGRFGTLWGQIGDALERFGTNMRRTRDALEGFGDKLGHVGDKLETHHGRILGHIGDASGTN